MDGDADIASVAAVIGNPARGRMLTAMAGGRALPASELARVAQVSPSTASAHLARLTLSGLVAVERHGRYRYHRLADERVAQVIEGLSALAPSRRVRSLREANQSTAERAARSCYDHLAGAVAVALADRLCESGALDRDDLSLRDASPFAALGVDVGALAGARRPLTRSCLDWSERRPHLAGGLGAALLQALLASSWVVRRPQGRAVAVTPRGRAGLRDALGLDVVAAALH
ncbi:MAG: ArsR family transcriptional regulator [Solirubrobacterales bacterium]|nr:ArsR family transcriptional regulator [Solirubrobacterales bacterium]